MKKIFTIAILLTFSGVFFSTQACDTPRNTDEKQSKPFDENKLTDCIWVGLFENSLFGRVRIAFKFPKTKDYYEFLYWDPKNEYPSGEFAKWKKVDEPVLAVKNIVHFGGLKCTIKDSIRLACQDNGSFVGNLFRIEAKSIEDWVSSK